MKLELVFNPKAEEWNNAYSLWCAREHFARACCCATATRSTRPRSRSGCWPAAGDAELVLALDDAKTLGEEEMKVLLDDDGLLRGINKALDPADGGGRVHRADADRAGGGRRRWPTRSRRPGSATRRCTTRTASRSTRDRGGRVGVAPIGGARVGRGRRPGRPRPRAGGGVPLLSRMVGAPLTIDIRAGRGRGPGAAARRPPDLERRPRRGRGRAGPGRGDRRDPAPAARQRRDLDGRGRHRRGGDASCARACARASSTRSSGSAAARRSTSPSTPRRSAACRWSRSPRASPTTASPRRSSSLEDDGRKASFGVQMPIAVVVDLDYVRASDRADAPLRHRRRRVQPLARSRTGGWPRRERGEPVDGLAVTFARTAADRAAAPRGRHRGRRLPDRARRGARAVRPRDGDRRLVAPVLAAPTTRSSTRSTTSSPAPRTTASWPASAASSPRACAATTSMARDIDACLAPPRAARARRRPRPDRRAVRRGRLPRARHPPGPLHDPRAPRPLRGGGGDRVRAYSDAYDR